MAATLKGACVGAGYFSQFHYEAWSRIESVTITGVCDIDPDKASEVAKRYSIENAYTNFERMLDQEHPDFVDIITPPATHRALSELAASKGVHVICQKPLAPNFQEAEQMVQAIAKTGVRFAVHENFRFQPWHQEIKRLLNAKSVGDKLHTLTFRSRPGDGWGPEAYLTRQPYFREMERFLIFETGIHFIDTFRYLAGEIQSVFAKLRKLNDAILGEDAGIVLFDFAKGAEGIWDANRFNESLAENPRYTFGEFLIEGNGGSIRLYQDGRLTIQPLGEPEAEHNYKHEAINFGGDCVFNTQQHFVSALISGDPIEVDATDYLQNLRIQDSIYQSAQERRVIAINN
jgi:predicted dehydrogenase